MIGDVGLTKRHGNEILDHVNIGYQIGEQYQRNGYAAEAVKTVVAWGFQELRKAGEESIITADIEHENWPSRKVAEKAGFILDEVKKYISVYQITG